MPLTVRTHTRTLLAVVLLLILLAAGAAVRAALVMPNSQYQQEAGTLNYQIAVDTTTGKRYLVHLAAGGAIDQTVIGLDREDGLAISADSVECGTSLTTVLTQTLEHNADTIQLRITNEDGAIALADFAVQVQASSGGAWLDYLTSTDFTDTSNRNVLWCYSDPRTLAASTETELHIRVNGAYAVRIKAASASSTVDVSITGGVMYR